jgi:NHL repeat
MNALARKPHFSRRAALLALTACLLALPFLAMAQPAGAEVSFCAPGSGAGQCSQPRGVAVDFETGHLYVADQGNNRVDVFKASGPSGEFLFAFGWGVDTGAEELQTCTTASGCQAGLSGSGAGQFTAPTRIAVDNDPASANRHDVYAGTDNFRVQHFEADGSFVNAFGWGVDTGAAKLETCTTGSGCQAGKPGVGECQFGASDRAIAVGPGGSVFVADAALFGTSESEGFISRVEKFSQAGACLGETKLFGPTEALRFQRVADLAVDGSEDAYVSVEGSGGFGAELRKYDLGSPESKLCAIDTGIGTNALALDEAGHLFAAQDEEPAKASGAFFFRVITEYDGACNHISRFAYGKIQNTPTALGLAAFHSSEGDVFTSEGSLGIHYLAIPTPGPVPAPPSVKADPLGNTKATLVAEINPEGKATSYHFEYLTREAWEAGGESFAGATITPVTSLTIPAGREFRVNAAEAVAGCPVATQQLIDEGKCLTPETDYVFRVIATNADNPTGVGEATVQGSFTTKAPIEPGEVYATEVGTDAATLNAEVNPVGIPAGGYFQYVDETTFLESGFTEAARVPDVEAGEAPIDFGNSETTVTRTASPFPLIPGTTYRYRLIVTNPFLKEPLISEEKAFTTFRPQAPEPGSCAANEAFRTGTSALLPDCRAYEMVSPLDKENADIKALTQIQSSLPAVLSQSATSGEKLAYGSYRSFGDSPSASYTSQYIAARGADGWQSHAITPPRGPSIADGVLAEFDFEFRLFSDDLCEGWVVPSSASVLDEAAEPAHYNLYRRTDRLCGAEGYEALSVGRPEKQPAGPGFNLEPQGTSADRTVTAFAANDSLEGSGAPAQLSGCPKSGSSFCQLRLYMRASGGQPRYVCILPSGEASKTPCSAGFGPGGRFPGTRSANLDGALSADGRRIFWTASGSEGKIYLRENPLGEGPECAEAGSPCTTAVSKDAEALSKTSSSHFWAAAKDGSVAIFSTGDIEHGEGDLYEYDVKAKATQKIAGGAEGFLGESEDATHVYFASTEVLSGEEENGNGDKAVPGKANLYLRVAGSGGFRFIGTLAAEDVNPKLNVTGSSTAIGAEPAHHNGRVSPSGLQATFMSAAPLSGYDNTDAVSGKADTEVFAYDASANGGAGELLCVSCNPGGARPEGKNFGTDANAFWVAGAMPPLESSFYPLRILSEDGSRLYFESQDPLVPRDTNGRLDVYQWERAGKGGCDQADPAFSSVSGGCVDLISSGKGLTDSTFVDATPSGSDVFFATLSSLLPQDYGLTDIYDARAAGGFPPPPPAPIPCNGDACQSPASPPNDPTPASASFRGAGDPAAHKKKHKKHAKKHKHAKKRHHRRAAR